MQSFHLTINPAQQEQLSKLLSECFSKGESCLISKSYMEAISHYEKALKLCLKIDALFSDIYNCYERIGMCYLEVAKQNPEQLIQAKYFFRKAIKCYSSQLVTLAGEGVDLQKQQSRLVYCHDQLVYIYLQQQKFNKATRHALKSFQSTRIAYANDIERMAICLENLAVCYKEAKDYPRAILCLESAINKYLKLPNVDAAKIQNKIKALVALRQIPQVKPLEETSAHTVNQGQSTRNDYVYGPSHLYPETKHNPNSTILSMMQPLSSTSAFINNSMYYHPQAQAVVVESGDEKAQSTNTGRTTVTVTQPAGGRITPSSP